MEDITRHRQAIADNIAKAFGEDLAKAHKDGDVHPNGKWYWNSSANGGKGDWRVIRKNKTQGSSAGNEASSSGVPKQTTQKPTSQGKSATSANNSNVVVHDINGTKVTVTKNPDRTYTLEANGKKVVTDDPSFYVFGTNIKPRVKTALAKEVGINTTSKKK